MVQITVSGRDRSVFKVNTEINKWYDFNRQGGNIIAPSGFRALLFCLRFIPAATDEQTPHISPVFFLFGSSLHRAEFSV